MLKGSATPAASILIPGLLAEEAPRAGFLASSRRRTPQGAQIFCSCQQALFTSSARPRLT